MDLGFVFMAQIGIFREKFNSLVILFLSFKYFSISLNLILIVKG